MRSVRLVRPPHVSSFRRIAIGSWRSAADPTVYGTLALRAEAALAHAARVSHASGVPVGVTHVLVRAIARAFAALPEANALLHWNRIRLRTQVDVAVLVPVTPAGEPPRLEPVLLEEADRLTLPELARRLEAGRARAADDASRPGRPGLLAKAFDLVAPEPGATAWVAEAGVLPFEAAYLPLVAHARVPLVAVPGAARVVPLVEDGAVRTGTVLELHASFDHRLLDGWHASELARVLRADFERADAADGPPEVERPPAQR